MIRAASVLTAVVAMIVGLLAPLASAQDRPLVVRMVAFAQGSATLWHGPCGETGLIDAGAGSVDEVVAAFDQAVATGTATVTPGSAALEWIHAGHYDRDHLGDVVGVAEQLGVETFIDIGDSPDMTPPSSANRQEYLDYVASPGQNRRAVDIGDTWTLCANTADEVVFEVLHAAADETGIPTATHPAGIPVEDSPNNYGTCLRVTYRSWTAATCGDIDGGIGGRDDIEGAVAPVMGDVDFATANHHLSGFSNSAAWLDAISPEAVGASLGANAFGHPHPDAISRHTERGIALYQTLVGDGRPNEGDLADGDLVITVQPASWTITGTASGRSNTYPLTAAPDPTPDPTSEPTPPAQGGEIDGLLFDGDATTLSYMATDNPAGAALTLSRHQPADSATAVLLATDATFADALAATTLISDDVPLLFAPDGTMPDALNDEIIRRLAPDQPVYILGGNAAVPEGQFADLISAGHPVYRIAGPTRIQTALAVAEVAASGNRGPDHILLARADDWADAIAGGIWAAHPDTRTVVLLTGTDTLHPDVAAWLAGYPDATRIALGGPAALSEAVTTAANADRIAGATRIDTTVATADRLHVRPPSYLVVDGNAIDGWAFALAAASEAATARAALLMTTQPTTPQVTLDHACSNATAEIAVLGNLERARAADFTTCG